jgi:hypothetical protein
VATRGNETYCIDGEYFYCDDHKPVATTWKDKPCGICHLPFTPEGHDPCIGTLPGVMNACCGHGRTGDAYVQFSEYHIIAGNDALKYIGQHVNGVKTPNAPQCSPKSANT